MRVTCLLGSPRKNGNSSAIAYKFCDILKKAGAEIEYIELNNLSYKGCQACDACKKTHDRCVLEDDLSKVLDAVQKSNVVILASPIYFGELTSQIKGFIDRMYSYIVPDYEEKIGKEHISRLQPNVRFVMIQTQKADETYFDNNYLKYEALFKMFLGIREMVLIRGCNLNKKSDANNDTELMNRVKSIAKSFMRTESEKSINNE